MYVNDSAPAGAALPSEPPDGPTTNSQLFVRFLLSGSHAGSIIGKGGATITEFEAQSGARIQLSRPKETFPGTDARLLLVSGTINALLTALHLVLSKLAAEQALGDAGGDAAAAPALARTVVPNAALGLGDTVAPAAMVRVVVPNAVCGALLGKEGATIRAYTEDSGATIKLSHKDAQPAGVTDRVVSISGELSQVLRATALVVTRVADEPGYPASIQRPYTYGPPGAAGASAPARGGRAAALPIGFAMAFAPPSPGPGAASIVVPVPDEHVGAVIGRGGATISEIQALSGVIIKISPRDEHAGPRKLTLTGAPEALQVCQFLVTQRVAQSMQAAEARRSSSGS